MPVPDRGLVQGEGLTFLHGAGGRGEVWQLQALAFPRARTPDLPGRPGDPVQGGVGAYVDGLRTVLGETAVVAGHSLGGAVALQHAVSAPPSLRAVILVGSGARLRVRPDWLARLPRDFEAVTAELVDQFFGPQAARPLREKTLAMLRSVSPAVLLADLRAADGFDVRNRLGGVLAPVLVVCGTRDRMTPVRYSEFLHAALPRADLVLIEEAGHMVMLERPQTVNAAIRTFLERLG